MKTRPFTPRLARLTLLVLSLSVAAACDQRPIQNLPEARRTVTVWIPESARRDLDLLFVIDDSGSMQAEQTQLGLQFPAMINQLRDLPGGLPNLHLGVTSTDLGAGGYAFTTCEEAGGSGGRLLRSHCAELAEGWSYVVDVEPSGCTIIRQNAACTTTCTQAGCDASEPGTTLVLDADGCPRCRNYGEATLEEVFRCLAGLGTTGCGFEQPLEAMYLALDDNPHNAGFLRERAFLGILFVTDEDDCSAADPSLFDTAADSPLGPLTGYRCFEHGITCQPTDDRNVLGPRTDCVPREDPDALLHPISRYVDLLHALKDPQLLMVSAIAGPTHGNTVTVGLDEYEQPMLEPSCTRDDGRADPGIRLAAFVEAFNAPEDLAWAYQSICSDDYSAALAGLGSTVRDHLDVGCLEAPLAGCTDPAVEHGLPGDGQPCNDVCRPQCEVEEIQARGMPSESRVPVPPCLEICQGGPCPGNQDRAQAYRSGHPDPRDPELPVEVCWHVSHQPGCSDSNAAELRLARRFDPPYRTFAQVTCVLLYPEETRCTDGKDNDEDCLIDALDPDCQ